MHNAGGGDNVPANLVKPSTSYMRYTWENSAANGSLSPREGMSQHTDGRQEPNVAGCMATRGEKRGLCGLSESDSIKPFQLYYNLHTTQHYLNKATNLSSLFLTNIIFIN